MTSAAWALQKALYTVLTGDAALLALLGEARIYDGAPRHAEMPYVTFEGSATTDADADAAPTVDHRMTVAVYARSNGNRDGLAIMERIGALLHDAALVLDAHALIFLRIERTEIRQQRDRRTWRGELRLHAMTEPLD